MDKFDLNSLTKEQLELAKKSGVELTIDEAQVYLVY